MGMNNLSPDQPCIEEKGNVLDSVFGDGTNQPNPLDIVTDFVGKVFEFGAADTVLDTVKGLSNAIEGAIDTMISKPLELGRDLKQGLEQVQDLTMQGLGR